MIFIFLYIIVSSVVGVHSWMQSGFSVGGSIILGSFLAFAAGSGLRGSLQSGTTRAQKITGFFLAIACIGVADWVGEGFNIQLFGIEITGDLWVWTGFFICLIFTNVKNED